MDGLAEEHEIVPVSAVADKQTKHQSESSSKDGSCLASSARLLQSHSLELNYASNLLHGHYLHWRT